MNQKVYAASNSVIKSDMQTISSSGDRDVGHRKEIHPCRSPRQIHGQIPYRTHFSMDTITEGHQVRYKAVQPRSNLRSICR